MARCGQVFLSYARADDEPFVERLRDALIALDVPVWWDRKSMESRGRTFQQELRDAIEESERVVAIIGPAALASPYVAYEWDHARLFCRAVLPLLRLGDWDSVPKWMAAFHTVDALRVDARAKRTEADVVDELVRLLSTPVPELAPLEDVPPLPPHYLERSGLPEGLPDKAQITVVRGMPGAGKSVFAAAMARTRATRMAFFGGIVWQSSGRTPSDALRQRLRDDPVLVVVDDAWSLDAVGPYRDALGPRGHLLITTRDASLASSLGTAEIVVDVLEPVEARALLAQWIGTPEVELNEDADALLAETGRLPLALAMIGALLRQFPDHWRRYLKRLRQARLDKIEARLPGYPHPDLARVIAVSVEALPVSVQPRFLDLAVLPDPAEIPAAVLESWWVSEGIDSMDAEDVVDVLVTRSLARRDRRGVVRLHDLVADYARHANPDVERTHRRLLAYYEARCEGGFATGPADGYYFQNLGHHLEACGRGADLLSLLLDAPDWLRAKLPAVRPDASGLEDVPRAARYVTRPEQEAALAMVQRVFRTEGTLWSNDDLETLVLLGRADEALQAAALRSQDPYPGYARLAQVYVERDPVAARNLVEQAERFARIEQAKADDRLTAVSELWRRLGDGDRAQKLQNARINPPEPRPWNEPGWFDETLPQWRLLEDSEERFRLALLLLSRAHLRNHPAAAQLREVIRAYPSTHGGWGQLAAADAVRYLALFGGLEEARELAASLPTASARAEAQFGLLYPLFQAGRLDDAIQVAEKLETIGERGDAFSLVACHLAARGDQRAAHYLEAARALRVEGHKRISFLAAAHLLGEALRESDRDAARGVLRLIAAKVRVLPADFDFSQTLADHARACIHLGLLAEAQEAMERIANALIFEDLLEELAIEQARAGHAGRAMALVDNIDPGFRQQSARARVFLEEGDLDRAAKTIDAIERDYNRVAMRARLAALTANKDSAQARAVLEQAEAEATALTDELMPELLEQEALGDIAQAWLDCDAPAEAQRVLAGMSPSKPKFRAALEYAGRVLPQNEQEAVNVLRALAEALTDLADEETAALAEDLAAKLAELGFEEDAREWIGRLSVIWRSPEERTRLARLHARMGDFHAAFEAVLAESIDLLIGTVASWARDYDQREAGLGRRVLAEVTRVAAWAREDWREVSLVLHEYLHE